MKTLFVEITGGLGNQWFQYAMALAWQAQTGGRLKLVIDDAHYQKNARRRFELAQFDSSKLAGQCLSARQKALLLKDVSGESTTWWHACLKTRHGLPWPRIGTASERSFYAEPDWFERINRTKTPLYSKGYWHWAGYFQGIHAQLAPMLQPKQAPSGVYAPWLTQIAETPNSVGVHVRRGDYTQLTQVFVPIEPQYYQAAAQRIVDLHGPCPFFVFSDDPDWAAQHVKLPGPTHIVSPRVGVDISPEQENPVWEFDLLRRCQHHIMPNSTFSWWAATASDLINTQAHKPCGTTILPTDWFVNIPHGAQQYAAPDWILL